MIINKLPIEIQERIFELQIKAGNKPNNNISLINLGDEGNFCWDDSEEGWSFWNKITEGIYDDFYKGKINNLPKIYTELDLNKALREMYLTCKQYTTSASEEDYLLNYNSIIEKLINNKL